MRWTGETSAQHEYIRADIHEAALAEKDREIERLRAAAKPCPVCVPRLEDRDYEC